MLIGTKYKVETDPMNIILYEKIEKKLQGDEEEPGERDREWRVIGYFSTLKNLLKYMVDHDIRGVGLSDLKTITHRQAELYILIESLAL